MVMSPLNSTPKPTKAEIEAVADQLAAWCTASGKSPLGEALEEAANVLYEAVDGWNEDDPVGSEPG